MIPEDVKKFVYSDLNLSQSEDSDRIFEISAIRAFVTTKFLLDLQQNPDTELSKENQEKKQYLAYFTKLKTSKKEQLIKSFRKLINEVEAKIKKIAIFENKIQNL